MKTPSGSFNLGYFFSRVNSPLCNIDPDRVAVKYRDIGLTYRELNTRINQVAHGLLDLGVEKGDKIGVLMYNCIEFFELFYAIAKIGGVMVPINFRLSPKELEYIINNSDSSALIYSEHFQETVDRIRVDLTKVRHYICKNNESLTNAHSYSSIFNNEMLSEPEVSWDIGMDDMQMIMYTSGTTGLPKGVVFTHSQLLWSAAAQVVEYSYKQDDVTLLTGPLYHVGALVDLSIGTTNIGGTNVIMPSLELDIEFLLKTIERERVTNLLLFPVMLIRIFELSDLSRYDLESLRFAIVGGERIDPLLLKKFQKKWPLAKAYQAYGLTEGSEFISILDSEFMISKAGSIGRPFFNVRIRLIDSEGKDVPVGEVGEILNQSPVTRGEYWKNSEETVRTFSDGWCRTGDLGRVDEDGFLWIVGRKKEMIRSAGENIYAAEVENVISSHPSVSEVAVYPVADPVMTESVMASVVLLKDYALTSEELIEYCKQHIASYKKPKYVEFIDSLPRTPTNKVMKYILQKKNKNIAKTQAG